MALLTKQFVSTFNNNSCHSVDSNCRNIHNEIHCFPPTLIITRILFLLTKLSVLHGQASVGVLSLEQRCLMQTTYAAPGPKDMFNDFNPISELAN